MNHDDMMDNVFIKKTKKQLQLERDILFVIGMFLLLSISLVIELQRGNRENRKLFNQLGVVPDNHYLFYGYTGPAKSVDSLLTPPPSTKGVEVNEPASEQNAD